MNKVYVISDTHFGDSNIIRFENRPFKDVEEMDSFLIDAWNKTVDDSDTVFHLGDVGTYSFDKMKEIISSLHGHKILVMGNHDNILSLSEWGDCGFDEVIAYPIIYNEYIVLQHEPPQYINESMPFLYIYGHVHSTKMYPTVSKQSSCVCVERWNYTPVDLESIKQAAIK